MASLGTATLGPDFKRANEVYEQCCIKIEKRGTATWFDQLTEERIGTDRILDVWTRVGKPTAEELAMTQGQGNNGILYAYYVKGMSQPPRGEACADSAWPTPPSPAVMVANNKAIDTFAHETGHVLLNSGAHSSDADNLMASGGIRNFKDLLTEAQCDKMRGSPLAR
jgi:hypothetical protein